MVWCLRQIPPMQVTRVRFLAPATKQDRCSNESTNLCSLYHCTQWASKRSLKFGKCVGLLDMLGKLYKCQHQHLYSRILTQNFEIDKIPADQIIPKWRCTTNIWNLAYWRLLSWCDDFLYFIFFWRFCYC